MNIERFNAIAIAVTGELKAARLPETLAELVETLRLVVAEPAQAGHQTTLSTARKHLNETLRNTDTDDFPGTWREALEELGITDLLGNKLREHIESVLDRNAMTPTAAADELEPVAARVEQMQTSFLQALDSLEFFGVGAEQLPFGEFEVGFLIPRDAVQENFQVLGEEFVKLNQLLGPFSEVATGSRPDIKVRSISSSGFQVFLAAAAPTALILAKTFETLVNSYEKLLSIRQKRAELKEDGVPDSALEQLTEHVRERMEADIQILAKELAQEAVRADDARKNELEAELVRALNKLANRIDLGYGVEVRPGELPPPNLDEDGQPIEDEDTEDESAREVRRISEQIAAKQDRLRFMKLPGAPILGLPEGSDDSNSENEPGSEDPPPQAPRPRRP